MRPYLLVVESDPELQRRIGETLREASYEVAAEADGTWAKRSLLVRAPQGVILGTHLSDGPGFTVAEAIRADPETRKVPIFFVASRYRGAIHQAEARRRYAPAEIVPTPVDLDTLLALVLETVPPSAPTDTTTSPAPSVPADLAQRTERRAVERTARELQAFSELRGSVEHEPFARVLARVYGGRRSGALLLVRDEVKKIVYFESGYPVSVRSNVLGECLGQLLLEQRLITRQVLDESLRRMKAEKKHQGTVLVEMGALSPFNVGRALIAQMEAKLYDLFSWRSGDFAFKEAKTAPDEPVRLEKTVAALVLEGIRRHYDQERVRTVLAPFSGRIVAPSSDPLRRLQDMTVEPAERRFIESLDGRQRLEAVLAGAPIPIHRARLLLVAMAEAGMIEPADEEVVVRAGKPSARPRHTPLVDILRPPDQRSLGELEAMLEELRGKNHFEALGLDNDAGATEIDAAYERRVQEYHPDRFRARPDDVREVASEIFDRLTEARSVLRDGITRRKYSDELERARSRRSRPRPPVGTPRPTAAAERVYFAAVAHLRARRYPEAVQAFRQATALAPEQARYRAALGWALYRRAPNDPLNLEAALAEIQRAVAMNPDDAETHVSIGRFHVETGRLEQAIVAFERALQLNPSLTDVADELRRLRDHA